MRITTLGPLAVDGRAVAGARLEVLVRELVDARGRAVSQASLVDAVWDGSPPDDPTGAVQALVSRARRLGLTVTAAPGGYVLPLDGVEVDALEAAALLDRARAALRDGRPSDALDLADAARGRFPLAPDLADVAGTRLLADVVAVRTQAALGLGRPPDDVDDLRALALRTPPDEPLVALLVRVLAAQGREAEALEVVERVRAGLADRYGADPSSVVGQVHVALLRGELAPRPAPAPAPRPDRTSPARAPGAPAAAAPFPAAPAAAAAPTTTAALPPSWRRPHTDLVGRADDVAALEALLVERPLVTVVATGGSGKTRLAAEVARRAAATGVRVRAVELAGVRDEAEVLPTVLAALGGTETVSARTDVPAERVALSPEDRLRRAVGELDGLLVLDNCEHVLGAAAAVAAVVVDHAPPGLAVLATSRAPLGVVGEEVHHLRALPDDEALALLEARARAGRASLAWDPERALELCHRLDNLPLALELAAARLRSMPVEDVLAGLTDRFGLLDDALRGLPERHASLWAMVDWSWALLDPAERDLLQRIAVVPAPFTAQTAVATSGDHGPSVVRRGLATLVEQSLLGLEEDEAGPPRYRMLETVREYGEVRLDAAGERERAMTGLARWAAAEAVRLGAEFRTGRQLEAYARCAQDVDTYVAVLRWAAARGREREAWDVAATLFVLWTVRGLHLECTAWAAVLLHADDPIGRRSSVALNGGGDDDPSRVPNPERLALAVAYAGVSAGVLDSYRLAALAGRAVQRVLAEHADALSPRTRAFAETLATLGSVDPQVQLRAADRLMAHDDPYVRAMGLFLRAAMRENLGETGRPAEDAREAYALFERSGDHWGMGMAAQAVGQFEGGLGGADADEWLDRGVRELELVGAVGDARRLQVMRASVRGFRGDATVVDELADVAGSPHADASDRAQALLGLAGLAHAQGRPSDAVAHADAAAALARTSAVGPAQARALYLVTAAVLRLRSGEPDAVSAAMLDDAAPDVAAGMPDMPVLGAFALGHAELAAHRGDLELARDLWAHATRLGATLSTMFGPALAPELTAVVGDDARREELLAPLRDRPVAEVAAHVRTVLGV